MDEETAPAEVETDTQYEDVLAEIQVVIDEWDDDSQQPRAS